MYNIADFLLVQLSLSRFTLIKSARSSHVCDKEDTIISGSDLQITSCTCTVNRRVVCP